MKRPLVINFGKVEGVGAGWAELTPEKEKQVVSENRWRLGEGEINGHRLQIKRRTSLDGYQYKVNDQLVAKVDNWIANEYQDWRDQ